MNIIKDPVHGYVEVEDFSLALLDSLPLQRLRYIRQLGFSYLVYPGANHTRFEHSLGTMFLADVAARRFGLSEKDRMLVVAAGLLHDIGHGPFSHASEPLMEQFLHTTHDDIERIVSQGTGALLQEHGLDPADLCSIVKGTHRLSGIIHGDLDVDRMDYLLRDAYYTGAPYGTVDAQRLIRHLIQTPEGGTVLDENGVNAAESLLIARTLMRPSVYFHHVSRRARRRARVGADAICPWMAAPSASSNTVGASWRRSKYTAEPMLIATTASARCARACAATAIVRLNVVAYDAGRRPKYAGSGGAAVGLFGLPRTHSRSASQGRTSSRVRSSPSSANVSSVTSWRDASSRSRA